MTAASEFLEKLLRRGESAGTLLFLCALILTAVYGIMRGTAHYLRFRPRRLGVTGRSRLVALVLGLAGTVRGAVAPAAGGSRFRLTLCGAISQGSGLPDLLDCLVDALHPANGSAASVAVGVPF